MAQLPRADQRIARAYITPGHPVAYSAPQQVAAHFGIGKARARRILEYIEGYTRHREFKQPRQYNPIYVHKRREQMQADLIDIGGLSRQNNGIRFLLLLIDVFTKRVWVYPLKSKQGVAVEAALKRWLRDLGRPVPDKLMTDQGTEFTNGRVQALLRQRGIEWQPALGTLKACVAERANKTIQILIYKYITEKERLRYVGALSKLVDTYNKRPHRTLEGMSPANADRARNEGRVQAIHHARYTKIAAKRRYPRFKVGEIVRIKTEPKKITSSARAYAEQFKGEYFRIVRINRTLPVPMYYLRSMDTDEFIKGAFYAEELQRQRGDVYKIERVIRERTRNGQRELYVKWLHFGDRWNQWIPAGNVVRRF